MICIRLITNDRSRRICTLPLIKVYFNMSDIGNRDIEKHLYGTLCLAWKHVRLVVGGELGPLDPCILTTP